MEEWPASRQRGVLPHPQRTSGQYSDPRPPRRSRRLPQQEPAPGGGQPPGGLCRRRLRSSPHRQDLLFDLFSVRDQVFVGLILTFLSRVADPELFGRSRIRKIFTGSGSYRYFGYVKLYKQGKNVFKIELLHIFKWIFPFFQIKIELILGKCQ